MQVGPARPDGALSLAGGWGWFTHVEVITRGAAPVVILADDLPDAARSALAGPRPPVMGLSYDQPRLMGIVNVTPDSFSDGGRHAAATDALAAGARMLAEGADILDIGGESTRPGATPTPADEETTRVTPVIKGLRAAHPDAVLSVDTRKASVAAAAQAVGADLFNDVSGFTYDPASLRLAAQKEMTVCVMHAQGDPQTMQQNPVYEDVLLDVYNFLEARIAALVAAGVPKARIIADPGIGFGKTLAHNLALLARLSLFHGLGVPVLLGASRKRFIGTLGNAPQADQRAPGSIGVALAALNHGIQVLRVHDVAQTRQAVSLWQACLTGRQ
ncbi:MAG: dihydropteroate synthase [Pseudomonadota bacterium]